jgi:hypothetical protein
MLLCQVIDPVRPALVVFGIPCLGALNQGARLDRPHPAAVARTKAMHADHRLRRSYTNGCLLHHACHRVHTCNCIPEAVIVMTEPLVHLQLLACCKPQNGHCNCTCFSGLERIAGHQHRQGKVPVIQQYWLMWPAELCGFKRVWLQAISSAWI